METFQQRLARDRIAKAEERPGARLSTGLASEEVKRRTVDDVAMLRPAAPEQAKAHEQTERPAGDEVVRVRNPTQHKFIPPGFGMGMGPTTAGMLIGTVTERQAFLNHQHAIKAHQSAPVREVEAVAKIVREPTTIVSDMRPTRGPWDDNERGGR